METSHSRYPVWLCGLGSVACFLLSLISRAYCTGTGGASCAIGWVALLMGWFELAAKPLAGLPWLANPLWLVGWVFMLVSGRLASIVMLGSLLCGLLFLGSPGVMQDESGGQSRIDSFEIGYWLWLASFALGLAAALLATRRSSKLLRTPQ